MTLMMCSIVSFVSFFTFVLVLGCQTTFERNFPNEVPFGTQIWRFQADGPVFASPVLGADGTLYVGSWDKKIYALDKKTGYKKWEFVTGGLVTDSPALSNDGIVYVGASFQDKNKRPIHGKVYALNAKTGVKIWEFKSTNRVDRSPALGTDGIVYVGSLDTIYALNAKTGVKIWEFVIFGGLVNGSPVLGADGIIYVGSNNKKIYALDGKSGAKKWEFEGKMPPASSGDGTTERQVFVRANESKVYAVFVRGNVYALDAKTGVKIWEFAGSRGNLVSGPSIGSDGAIYVGSEGKNNPVNYLYALDGKTGEKKWEYSVNYFRAWHPAVDDDGTLYFGFINRSGFYALDGKNGAHKYFPTDGNVQSIPTVDSDGTVYVGTNLQALNGEFGYIYAIKPLPKGP